jgi:hypothetical protein
MDLSGYWIKLDPLHYELVPYLEDIDSIPADYSRNENDQIPVEDIDAGHGIVPDLGKKQEPRSRAVPKMMGMSIERNGVPVFHINSR